MTLLNKLIITQNDIFLAPGHYFHPDFNGDIYHQLPLPLQQQHNQKLIEQYALPLPENRTPLLPKVLSMCWTQLPTVAIYLGLLLDTKPWAGKLPEPIVIHTFFRNSLRPSELLDNKRVDLLMALGATQILAYLAPFGKAYTLRAKYLFSITVQKMISAHNQEILPWNIIEETCRYIIQNNLNRNKKYETATDD